MASNAIPSANIELRLPHIEAQPLTLQCIDLQPFHSVTALLNSGILDIRHVEEPGYSTYAVMQVTSSLVTADLKRLVELVKELVGDVDFPFRFVESAGEVGMEKEKKD